MTHEISSISFIIILLSPDQDQALYLICFENFEVYASFLRTSLYLRLRLYFLFFFALTNFEIKNNINIDIDSIGSNLYFRARNLSFPPFLFPNWWNSHVLLVPE